MVIIILATVPVILYLILAERLSWRPRTLQHRATVTSVAFSPDGKLLVTGVEAPSPMIFEFSEFRLWDFKSKRLLRSIRTNSPLRNLAFAPNGQVLAATDYRSPRLLDVRSGKTVRTLRLGKDDDIRCLAFSPNGKLLAIPGSETLFRVWDISSGKLRQASRSRTVGTVTSVAFSPDGGTIAVTNTLETHSQISVLNTATGKLQRTLWHGAIPMSMTYSLDGRMLATGGHDGAVKLYDSRTGRILRTFRGHSARVWCVTFSPDNNTLASASHDSTVKLWNVSGGVLLRTLTGHIKAVHSIAISPDGATLASSSADGTVKL